MPIHDSRSKFHEHGIHACKWYIFMRMMTAKLISELGWKTGFHAWQEYRILQWSRHDKITIVQCVFRTLTLWNSLSRYCHECSRPDLKIHFSNSSNKHGTGKADEIFTEIWRVFFSPCENSASIPLDSDHEIPEGGSRSFLMGSYYIWVLRMKKDNYRKWTVEIKIKLQHHQLVQNRVQSFWHGKQLMKTSSIRSNIFKKPFATGALPQTPLREFKPPRSLIATCVAPLMPRSDSCGHRTLLIAAPREKKYNKNSVQKSNIVGYQYSPILFRFCFGTPNILWL